MASLSSSTNISSSASTIRGYGGLASGLDRDTLIESMTAATRSKIAKQKQKKQTYTWQQEAYRSISSPLIEFAQKYMSYTSSTNLSSSAFWSSSSITSLGTNSKYVSVTGSSSLANSISVVGVKSLAQSAAMSSKSGVSDGVLNTGAISIVGDADGNLATESVSKLEGQTLTFQYGGSTSYSVKLGSGTGYDYSSADGVQKAITKSLEQVSIGDGQTLADIISVETTPKDGKSADESTDFSLNLLNKSANQLKLTGGSQTALTALGVSGVSDDAKSIDGSGFSSDVMTAQSSQSFYELKDFASRVGGKNISFTYNGTTKTVSFQDAATLRDKINTAITTAKTEANKEVPPKELTADDLNEAALGAVAKELEAGLDKAFGTDRIAVGHKDGQLTFLTTKPADGSLDTSSVLTISDGSSDVIGKTGALNVVAGESNRISLSSSLTSSGLSSISEFTSEFTSGADKALAVIDQLGLDGTASVSDLKAEISDKKDSLGISDDDLNLINQAIDRFKKGDDDKTSTLADLKQSLQNFKDGGEMELTINGESITGLTYSSSLTDIMKAINASAARVTVSYTASTDKFSIISTEGGASGAVELKGWGAELIFGKENTDYNYKEGTDAVVAVKYAGSDSVEYLTRGSNTFNLDGLNVSVSGTFGYNHDDDGNATTLDTNAEAVTFSSKTDTDKITSAVSDMIKDYNAIIDLVNSQLTTKPNRDYAPLTDEQKEDMTESQITAWESKAKTGLLFNDSDLRTLSDSMRFIINSGSTDKKTLETYGITISSTYGDNGKLVFDETKFRAALESDPETLKKVFTKTANSSTGDGDGVMARMKAITDKYASTSGSVKGILVEKAGSTYSPISVLSNSFQKSMDSLDDYIKTLQDKLSTETDRYISQFTTLETLISQMNSQSSYLSSLSS